MERKQTATNNPSTEYTLRIYSCMCKVYALFVQRSSGLYKSSHELTLLIRVNLNDALGE